MSIRKKTAIMFLILTLAFSGMLVNMLFILNDYKINNERAKISYLQLATLEKINSEIIGQMQNLTAYLLNMEEIEGIRLYTPVILSLFDNWDELIVEEIAFVSASFEDDLEGEEEEEAYYEEIKELYGEFTSILDQIIRLHESGNRSEALELYRKTTADSGIYSLMTTKDLTLLIDEEQEEVISLFGKTVEKHTSLFNISLFIIGFTMILMLSVFLVLRRTIISRLSKLERATNIYQPGEIGMSIDTSSKDEIGSLSTSIVDMMYKINSNTIQMDYVDDRIDDILSVVDHITSKQYDYLCNISSKSDVFDRLSLGINAMINDLLAGMKNIQEQHDWLDLTLGNIGDGIISTDKNLRITYMNSVAEDLTGWKAKDVKGKNIEDIFRVISSEKRALKRLPLLPILNNEDVDFKLFKDLSLVSRDRREIPLETFCATIDDSKDHIWGILLVFRDITNLIKKNNELEKLQIKMIQKEKLSSIGLLSAGMAHEINNPIAYLESNFRTLDKYMGRLKQGITLLQSKSDSEEKTLNLAKLKLPKVMKDMDIILEDNKSGITKISRIVEAMKTFSRKDDQDILVKANINKLVKDTLKVSENETKYTATIETDLNEVTTIDCIPEQVNQVLLNIILNASQAIDMDENKDANKKGLIKIRTREDDNNVFCHISDNGTGFKEENIKKLFDPFFTTKDPGKGTGLGLNVSYNIMKKHNGEIIAANNKTKGATFTLTFPIIKPNI